MGFYERRIFPWLNDTATGSAEFRRIRTDALAGARGRVLEIGFGSGKHIGIYPEGIESIVGIEPNAGMRSLAEPLIRASRIPVEVKDGRAESIPAPDASADTAVSVLTLCSVSDPGQVLSELRRVLRDDGRLIVVEHGLADDPGVARWQRRLNPIQHVIGCGCNLDRPVAALVERHGFRFESLSRFYVPKVPRTHGWITAGTAVKA